jgi:hypothetical protein
MHAANNPDCSCGRADDRAHRQSSPGVEAERAKFGVADANAIANIRGKFVMSVSVRVDNRAMGSAIAARRDSLMILLPNTG